MKHSNSYFSRPVNSILLSTLFIFSLMSCDGKVSVSAGNDTIQVEPQIVDSQLIANISMQDIGIFSGHLSLEQYQNPIEYGLYVPEIPSGEKVPLILALHFSDGQGLPFLEGFVHPGLSELEAIIISPTVPNGSDWVLGRTNTMLVELIELAIKNWPVDSKKIIVMGYSMGGFGTWGVVSSNPELFSAAIPIASSPRQWLDTISTQVPIYAIHPEFDENIPLNQVEEDIQILKDNGVDVQLTIARDSDHYDLPLVLSYLYDSMDWVKHTVWANQQQNQ